VWVVESQMIDRSISELYQGRKESCIELHHIVRPVVRIWVKSVLAAGNKHNII